MTNYLQLPFFDDTPIKEPDYQIAPETTPEPAPELTLAERFQIFDDLNPQVYYNLRTLCRRWRDQGHRKAGIDTLFGILRWQHAMSTTGDSEGFKLNNNYKSFYARKLMEENPDFAGMFELRQQRSKGDTTE